MLCRLVLLLKDFVSQIDGQASNSHHLSGVLPLCDFRFDVFSICKSHSGEIHGHLGRFFGS